MCRGRCEGPGDGHAQGLPTTANAAWRASARLVRQARANGMRRGGSGVAGPDQHRPRRFPQCLHGTGAAAPRAAWACSASRPPSASPFTPLRSAAAVGMSTVLSAGNRADVSGNDMMQFWEDDADTTALWACTWNPWATRASSPALPGAWPRSKPVIVAKSDAMGLRLPPGHAVRTTQAPAGALDAMLRQSGVIRVDTIEELMDVAQIVVQPAAARGPGTGHLQQLWRPGHGGGRRRRAPRAGRGASCEPTLILDIGQSVALPALRAAVAGGAGRGGGGLRRCDPAAGPWPDHRRASPRRCTTAPLRRANRSLPSSPESLIRQLARGCCEPESDQPADAAGESRPASRVPCFSSPGRPSPRWPPWSGTRNGRRGNTAISSNPPAWTREGCRRPARRQLARGGPTTELLPAGPAKRPGTAGPLRHRRAAIRAVWHRRRGRDSGRAAGLARRHQDHGPERCGTAWTWAGCG